MRRFGRYRFWRLLPAIAFLAVQLAAVPLPTRADSSTAHAIFAALDVDRIVICTPEGRKTIDRGDGVHGPHCPICLGFPVADLPNAQGEILRDRPNVRMLGWAISDSPQVQDTTFTVFRGRAPPCRII